MRFKRTKKVLALVLSVCMLMSMAVAAGASASAERATGSRIDSIASKADAIAARLNSYKVDDDESVKAIITLSGESMLDNEFAGKSVSNTEKARYKAVSQQSRLKKEMSSSFSYDLLYSYSAVLNGLAISTKFSNLKKIAAMDGVTGVYLANTYSAPEYDVVPQVEQSAETMGVVNSLRTKGYDGDGIVIAVLDTGFRVSHEAFQDYGNMDTITLTRDKMEDVDTLYEGKWLSNKIPYAYDYADRDDDVVDAEDEHGTHVAGIACGYTEAADKAVTFSGEAPAAQLLAMKIFSSAEGSSGTDSAIYFAALEDAYLLNADVINMSIGKPGGYTYDKELEDAVFGNVYEKLNKIGVVTCVAAGNEYNMGYSSYSPYAEDYMVPTSYTDYGTVGSPSTFRDNLSIASVENVSYPAYLISAYGENFAYTDNSEKELFLKAFGGKDVKYVVVPNVGNEDDFDSIADSIPASGDWVALVQRGEITFEEKLENAYLMGASAMICYNNADGDIGMQIENYLIPAVSIKQTSGKILVDNANKGVGTLTVTNEMKVINNEKAGQMTDFSGWGTTPDLAFKPQVAAPGGNIYSAGIASDTTYVVLSGTSMACPNAAGFFACMLQYIRDNNAEFSKKEAAEYAKKLVLSTANIITNPTADNVTYSPRKQGAGIMNADNALKAGAYIENSLVELGDDKTRTGKFEFTFDVTGLTKADKTYDLSSIVLSDDCIVDSETEVAYSTITALDLLKAEYATVSYSDNSLTISGTETKTVTVKVELTAAGKEHFNEFFENGTFVEGYVVLKDSTGSTSSIHASFLGYYGDWLQAPILESLSYQDVVDIDYSIHTNDTGDGTTYAQQGYSASDFLYGECIVGYNQAYLYSTQTRTDENGMTSEYGAIANLGDNLFGYKEFDSDHMAISNASGDSAFADMVLLYPMQLRAAAHMIMVISNAKTNQVYYVDDTPYSTKAYENEGAYYAGSYFMWDGVDSYDGNSETYGEYIEQGEMLNIQFFSWLDYDKDTQKKFKALEGDYTKLLTSDWADKKVWSLDNIEVDTTAPKMESLSFDARTNMLSMSVSDNHYLAYVGVSDDMGNYMLEATPDLEKGGTYSETLDFGAITGDIPDTFYIEAADYAVNYPMQEMRLVDGVLGIDDYVVQVFNEDGSKNEAAKITLKCGGDSYDYGDVLPNGKTYDVFVDGKDSGVDMEIECFGYNAARVGKAKEYVNVFTLLGDSNEYFTPDGDVTIVGNGETFKLDQEEMGKFTTYAYAGEYEVYVNGKSSGVKFKVGENEDNYTFLQYYTLSFDDNTTKYNCTVPASAVYLMGTEVEVTDEEPTCEGYSFKNWNTTVSGSGTDYKKGDVVTINADVTLYAIWSSGRTSTARYGDVDCDGKISMNDVTSLQRIIASLDKYADLGSSSETNADANGDGKVSMMDVTEIQRFIAGLVTELGKQ